jgi:histidine triad (HIT) family protein
MVKSFLVHLFSRLLHIWKSADMTCIFCKIIAGEAKADIVYRNEHVTAFRDNQPVSPTHVLIVPNRHIESVNQAEADDVPTLGNLFLVARKIAEMEKIQGGGYRLIVNTGVDGGQTVFHLHMHLIGGRSMRHPIG